MMSPSLRDAADTHRHWSLFPLLGGRRQGGERDRSCRASRICSLKRKHVIHLRIELFGVTVDRGHFAPRCG